MTTLQEYRNKDDRIVLGIPVGTNNILVVYDDVACYKIISTGELTHVGDLQDYDEVELLQTYTEKITRLVNVGIDYCHDQQ